MKIISWNINGIRAWYKKDGLNWILRQKPDFFCFQETKANPEQLSDEIKMIEDYSSFFEYSKGDVVKKHEFDRR